MRSSADQSSTFAECNETSAECNKAQCVPSIRKGEQVRDEIVKEVNCQILREGEVERKRWAKYFKRVLNVDDVIEASINVVVGFRTLVLRELNERAIISM